MAQLTLNVANQFLAFTMPAMPTIVNTPVPIQIFEGQECNIQFQMIHENLAEVGQWSLLQSPFRMSINSNTGLLEYIPGVGDDGEHAVRVRVTDSQNRYSEQKWIFTVLPLPSGSIVANNDIYSTLQNTTLNVVLPGILSNDIDPIGQLLTPILASGVSHGMLTLNKNGSFTYIPNNNYTGQDSFTYKCRRYFSIP